MTARIDPNSTKQRLYSELARTPGLWMPTTALRGSVGYPNAGTVARALRKLREEGKVISRKYDNKGRQEWRVANTSAPAPTNVISIQPGNGTNGASMSTSSNIIPLNDGIDKVLDDFTQAQKTFSAHDVTLELRDRVNTGVLNVDSGVGTCHHNGKDVPRIVHDTVRDYVHGKYDRGEMAGYDRTDVGAYQQYAPATTAPVFDTSDVDSDDDDGVDGDSYDGSAAL